MHEMRHSCCWTGILILRHVQAVPDAQHPICHFQVFSPGRCALRALPDDTNARCRYRCGAAIDQGSRFAGS